ncbi:uracil-DNA glycosylase [Roseospira goensis]|uniref:Type-5 uracil-DNA glycosylase n=1 Tax=Roseospira goensis TaxID=391922 RepID=A0A7W6RWY4_9PROT|nr:uracil-DNA glycosylase [Roseospira goensis]MBB4284763.1 uracil-DNA glycosylase family 4 [Roseospira goensis]
MVDGPAPPAAPRQPPPDCALCPRLAAFRAANVAAHADWFNAPVPAFGPVGARLLVVGLAPGLRGANRTGRPFTGDVAGVLLYETLIAAGVAEGPYAERADDGLTLTDCRIVNAVRCVPPENKPTPAEIRTCRPFLEGELEGLDAVRAILALGKVAHDAVVRGLGLRLAAHPFGHGARHPLPDGRTLFDSYHCSRYNQNTGRLTPSMFREVVAACVRAVGDRHDAARPG